MAYTESSTPCLFPTLKFYNSEVFIIFFVAHLTTVAIKTGIWVPAQCKFMEGDRIVLRRMKLFYWITRTQNASTIKYDTCV